VIDIKQSLVTAIKSATDLNVYYEVFKKEVDLPAITYKEIENCDLVVGDTIEYSTLRFEIKIWSYSMDEIILTSKAIDIALKAIGFSRYSSFETNYQTQIIKVLRYVATGYNEV